MSSLRREMEGSRERREGESMHSEWEFICHSRAQSYFKRLMRDMEKGEMRPLMWNDMPDDRGRGEWENEGEAAMNHGDRGTVRPTVCKKGER